ncbi:MAG: hypothetical protein JXI43_10750 [Tissierellales bacterium]|nr:hypothetical protein [Tissierellales bacterium]
MTKKRINIEEIIRDIKKTKLSDLQMMEKYQLDNKQLVFVLGKLADDKHISFGRMINAVKGYLTGSDIEKAEECFAVIEKYFPKASGVKTLKHIVENAVDKKKSQDEFQRHMQKPSPSLKWFKSEYPRVTLHPEIERMIKVTDIYSDTSNSHVISIYQHLTETPKRLTMIAKINHLFSGLSKYEANRMWHYIMLVTLAENGIETFFILDVMDSMTCSACERIGFTHFPVKKVRESIIKRLNSNSFLPKKLFPSVEDIDNMPPNEKVRVLMENGWYLPPFCDNCRCQIIPTALPESYFAALHTSL